MLKAAPEVEPYDPENDIFAIQVVPGLVERHAMAIAVPVDPSTGSTSEEGREVAEILSR